jgi:hypothetical protein
VGDLAHFGVVSSPEHVSQDFAAYTNDAFLLQFCVRAFSFLQKLLELKAGEEN